MQERGYEKSEINEIANMAFITGRTNQRLSRKPPEEYFPEIINLRGEASLQAQQVPIKPELWKVENYRSFLQERRRMLAGSINQFVERAFIVGSVKNTDSA